jgi:hypothetical protein
MQVLIIITHSARTSIRMSQKKIKPITKKQAPLPGEVEIQEGIDVSDQEMEELLKNPNPIRFDTKNKWMKGEQYQHVLVNLNAYCKAFDLQRYE